MAFALSVEDEVIFAVLNGVFLSVAGVKVGGVFGYLFFYPVDVVVEQADGLLGLVDDFDFGGFSEGHVPEAVVGVGVLDDDRQADNLASFTEAVCEEITDGGFDGEVAVPEHPQEHFLMICRAVFCPGVRLRTEKGHPDMRDYPGPFSVHEDPGLPGGEGLVVVVTVGIGLAVGVEFPVGTNFVGGGFAHTSTVLRAGQVGQGIGKKALGQREQEQKNPHDKREIRRQFFISEELAGG